MTIIKVCPIDIGDMFGMGIEKVLIEFNNDIVNSLKKKGTDAVSVNSAANKIFCSFIE